MKIYIALVMALLASMATPGESLCDCINEGPAGANKPCIQQVRQRGLQYFCYVADGSSCPDAEISMLDGDFWWSTSACCGRGNPCSNAPSGSDIAVQAYGK